MLISEVQYLLAAPNASAGYSSPGTVYNSNGMYCSTTQVNGSVVANNIFPDLTGPQVAAQQVDYQCLFIYNSDTTSPMVNTKVWFPSSSILSSAVNWEVAPDPTGVTAYNFIDQQAVSIANPLAAPAGVTGWMPPSADSTGGVNLATIGPRQVAAVWLKRSATGLPASPAGFDLQVTFDV
jgi:hypothetical protein